MSTNPGTRADVRDFLITRRARITPAQAGLPETGRRRVPGLRREEVAVLAGVSAEWYSRLEKGHIDGVSGTVLDAVARALRLDDGERAYLFDLARAARAGDRDRPADPPPLPANVQWLLDSMTLSAALVCTRRMDIVAMNPLGRVLFAPILDSGHTNLARHLFLDPGARRFYGEWDGAADVKADLLRGEAGRNPHDRRMQALVAELSARSPEFRARWTAHNIDARHEGAKVFHHPEAGPLSLAYRSMVIPVSAGLSLPLCVYTPEPGSASEDTLKVLASWAATGYAGAR
ncbi:transcriptional regulator with XRE-family HTH domain [Catenuloplanes nepalensis]|uniref:Transcriptional regulator with XRE-family HTH domain n=1 Tax=Catenuloplanes nepalensis TaxID=587533 RepID=A0ABT9MQR4_9ACTN|nr:helix-turn-helix transcriptional regulator [Catenuloplanes nepalensis]MDP9793757.1 transcriptional regulator with XRE-family HTH domain [Catenuloplanes nepalensis]